MVESIFVCMGEVVVWLRYSMGLVDLQVEFEVECMCGMGECVYGDYIDVVVCDVFDCVQVDVVGGFYDCFVVDEGDVLMQFVEGEVVEEYCVGVFVEDGGDLVEVVDFDDDVCGVWQL